MCFKTCVIKILKSVCLKAKDFEGNAPSAPSLLYTWLLSMEPQHGTSNCCLIFFTAISFAFHCLFSSFDGNCWCPPWDPQVCIDHLWGVISVSVQCENIFWVFSTAIEENSTEMFWQLGESIALKIISSLLDLSGESEVCRWKPISRELTGLHHRAAIPLQYWKHPDPKNPANRLLVMCLPLKGGGGWRSWASQVKTAPISGSIHAATFSSLCALTTYCAICERQRLSA